MIKFPFASLAILTAAAIATSAHAQSLMIRERMASQTQQLAEAVTHTNQVCEANISVKFDWKDAPEAQLKEYSPSSFCDAALGGIRRTCGTPLGKEAVKQKITSVTCGFGPARTITLKDGAVDYKIEFSSSNDSDYVFEFLQNNL